MHKLRVNLYNFSVTSVWSDSQTMTAASLFTFNHTMNERMNICFFVI